MGRRPKAAVEAAVPEQVEVSAPEAPTSTPRVVRRRRTITRVDHGAQQALLVGSLLKGRGSAGASQEELLAVVNWARGVHAEADELKALATRVRRAKAQNASERQVALSVNQILLDGVLSGALIVDVNAEGGITFKSAE